MKKLRTTESPWRTNTKKNLRRSNSLVNSLFLLPLISHPTPPSLMTLPQLIFSASTTNREPFCFWNPLRSVSKCQELLIPIVLQISNPLHQHSVIPCCIISSSSPNSSVTNSFSCTASNTHHPFKFRFSSPYDFRASSCQHHSPSSPTLI